MPPTSLGLPRSINSALAGFCLSVNGVSHLIIAYLARIHVRKHCLVNGYSFSVAYNMHFQTLDQRMPDYCQRYRPFGIVPKGLRGRRYLGFRRIEQVFPLDKSMWRESGSRIQAAQVRWEDVVSDFNKEIMLLILNR